MTLSKLLTSAALLATSLVLAPAQAAPQAIEPVQLEAVIVTPTARYTATEWAARVAARQNVATIVLEPVIVTPTARYTLAEWQQRKAGLAYAKAERRTAKAWLKMVWKHFQFSRSQLEA